jgi:hypothetical protein
VLQVPELPALEEAGVLVRRPAVVRDRGAIQRVPNAHTQAKVFPLL